MKSVITLVSLMIFASEGANAFVYSESVSGDIDGHGNTPMFQLDAGLNVISGSANMTSDVSDSDAFGFNIPSGCTVNLNQMIFEYTITSTWGTIYSLGVSLWLPQEGSDGSWDKSASALHHTVSLTGTPSSPYIYIYSNGFRVVSPSPVSLQFNTVSDYRITSDPSGLVSGKQWLVVGGAGNTLDDFGLTYDYSIHIPVTVPETSSLSLAIIAICGAFGIRSRRCAQM